MAQDVSLWIGFSMVSGIGPARLQALLDYYGDIQDAWQADSAELRAIGLDNRTINNLIKVRQQFDREAILEPLERLGVTVLTWDSPDYPPMLKNIPDPPMTLYVRGTLTQEDQWAVAVVGTRKATPYGKDCARMVARGLAESGTTVISGLAYGIDTEAHRTTIETGGRTLAVLGCGVDVVYPAANRNLSHKIIESGALISEYPLGTKPDPHNFPRRNRIISGLSLGVVVVEGHIKSGACITARFASEQGREVFAIPGPILRQSSSGPNYLIQNGAKLVITVNDILDELNLTMLPQQAEARAIIPDNEAEATLLKQLSTEPLHIDELGQRTGLTAAEISSLLMIMELKGMVRQMGSMNYVLAH